MTELAQGRGSDCGDGEGRMRRWLPFLLVMLVGCSSSSPDSSKLTLRNLQWEHVNVQLVITKGSDCDERSPEFVNSQNFVLHHDQTKTITAPPETNVCWRRDRYPTNPHPGEWSGWSHATMTPGSDTTTDL
jgi:hypothetical protein